jgi:hypothetical protein
MGSLSIVRTLKISGGQGRTGSTRKPRSRLLYLDVSPRHHLCSQESNPECHPTNTVTLATTVIQKTATKRDLEHL